MRNPHNEALGAQTDAPIRRCILTGERGERAGLIRLALSPGGAVLPDLRAKAPGRGAWIGVDQAGLAVAIAKGRLKGALARAFKTSAVVIADDLPAVIAAQLERALFDRLGLEARAGHLLIGSERIATAARGGKLHLLLHAADASEDGTRKLDQAWRVGSDAEASGLRGLAMPFARQPLSMALGRENVVHIGITDAAAAARLRAAIDRWRNFVGAGHARAACELPLQGASGVATGQASDAAPIIQGR